MIAGNPIMAGGKKPSGSVNITANGTYDVAEKASAVVNVPNPSSGSLDITANGTYDVTEKASAVVNVPNPSSGTLNITENGTYNVTEKASAVVNVASAPVLLWTNPSPDDDFPAQTVSFSGSYNGFLIETMDASANGDALFGISFVKAGTINTSIGASEILIDDDDADEDMLDAYTYAWYRLVADARPYSISFSGGSWNTMDGYRTDGRYARPTRIWGVHFTVV